jgi:small membrane protein
VSLIQLILIILVVLATGTYFRRYRSCFLDNAIVATLGVGGVVMIVMPQWTTAMAHLLGVGRGVDLVMYLGWIAITFVSLLLYSKLRSMELKLTEVVRSHAIDHARRPEAGSNNGKQQEEGI